MKSCTRTIGSEVCSPYRIVSGLNSMDKAPAMSAEAERSSVVASIQSVTCRWLLRASVLLARMAGARTEPPTASRPSTISRSAISVPYLRTRAHAHALAPPSILGEEMAGRHVLDKEDAGPHWQPQIPAQRQAKTGPRGRQGQQAPRLPFLPVQDGVLLDWPISGMEHTPSGHHQLVVPVQHPDPGASIQELPPMAMPAEDPLDDRPQRDHEASWPHPAPGPHQHRGTARR